MSPSNTRFTPIPPRRPLPETCTQTLAHYTESIGDFTDDWLWPNVIPCEQFTLLAGQPGIGKTSIALDIAARVTTGAPFPFDTNPRPRDPADVLLIAPEDNPVILAGRLQALGADLNRIHHGRGDISTDPTRDDPADVVQAIWGRVTAIRNVGLIIIDPLQSILTRGTNNPTVVRSILDALTSHTSDCRTPIIAVAHTIPARTQHAYRIMGSAVLSIAPRVIWEVQQLPNSQQRALLPAKCIIADPPALTFTLTRGVPNWIAQRPDLSRHPTLNLADRPIFDAACDFLTHSLCNGPKPATESENAAEAAGISLRTLHRAKRYLEIASTKTGAKSDNSWIWALPSEGCQIAHKTVATFTPQPQTAAA